MSGTDILFYLFATLIVASGILTVTLKHVLHAAICLMGCLFATGSLFLLMNSEFVALMQVLVYVGGIVIFIIYSVLLTSDLGEKYLSASILKRSSAAFAAIVFAAITAALFMGNAGMAGTSVAHAAPGIETIGMRLLSTQANGFLIPFEVISVILLVALISSSTIARKLPSKRSESENI